MKRHAWQSIHRHERLELQKLAQGLLWRYAAKTMASILRGTLYRHRGERHVLQTTGQKHVPEVARQDARRFCVRDQRTPLRHAQQEADRCGRISDSLS